MRSIAVLMMFVAVALAQSPEGANVRGDSPTTLKRLAEAEQLLLTGKAVEARDAITKIVIDAGDDLIHIGGGRYTPTRQVAQSLFGKLPAEQLEAFRKRSDPAADRALATAKTTRDIRQLEDVAETYFYNRTAAAARLMLGDLAFERGEFGTAELHWLRLTPDSKHRHTGSDIDQYGVQARIALAAIHRGDLPRAARLTTILEQANSMATGYLAGREGNYVETLKALIANPPKRTVPKPQLSDWQTLGGSPTRSGHVPGNLIGLPASPAWTAPLSGGTSPSSIIGTVRRVGFHGIFDDRYFYLAQAGQILAFDTTTGTQTILFDTLQLKNDPTFAEFAANDWHDADFTLTLASGHLYARVGPATVLPRESGERPTAASALIRLDAASHDELPRKLAWIRKPPVDTGIVAGWEGAPLIVEGRILAAFTRLDGGRAVQSIACFDERLSKPLWVTEVCEVGTAGLEKRERQELLTLAGRNVVFASQSGVVAAVDTVTGKHAWSFRYPSVKLPRLDGRHRDLSPPVAGDGRVFVAPNDSDTLFAFDADSGAVLWKVGPTLIDHIIGVADGKVIAAIAGPQRGLRAFDVHTGSTIEPAGWQNHDDPGLGSFGRGCIVGDHLAWPTQYGLHIIRVSDGFPARIPLPGPQGNLAFAAGRLAVVTPKEVRFYRLPDALPPENTPTKPIILTAVPRKVPADVKRISIPFTRPVIINPVPRLTQLDAKSHIESDEIEAIESAVALERTVTLQTATGIVSVNISGNRLRCEYLREDAIRWKADLPLPVTALRLRGDSDFIARLGEHHLTAIDLETGHLRWVLDHNGKHRFWPHTVSTAPRYDGHFFSDHHIAIVRRSDRKVLFLNSETGDVRHEHVTAADQWITPPVSLNDNCFAFSDGPGRITAVGEKFQTLWTFDAGRPASQSGQAAQLHRDGNFLNVLVHRNHGLELDRIRIDSGKPVWHRGPAVLADHGEQISDAVSDAKLLFVPGRDRLTIIALDTGRITAEVALPQAPRWRLHRVENALVAVPMGVKSPAIPKPEVVLRKKLVNVIAAIAEPDLPPILILDPETGAVRHRLDVPSPIVSSGVTPRGLEVATRQTLYRIQ